MFVWLSIESNYTRKFAVAHDKFILFIQLHRQPSCRKIFFSTQLHSHFAQQENRPILSFSLAQNLGSHELVSILFTSAQFSLYRFGSRKQNSLMILFVVPFDTLQLFLTCLIERTLKQHNVYIGCVNVNHHRRASWRDSISYRKFSLSIFRRFISATNFLRAEQLWHPRRE